MKITEIPCSRLSVSSIGELAKTVQDEARELLGYNAREAVERAPEPKPLAEALTRLEIEVLDKPSVIRYQGERAVEFVRKKSAEITPESRYGTSTGWYLGYIWECEPLEKHKDAIPEHILLRAIEIKKTCPGVQFFVEFLNENPDPFLIAVISENKSSWDEFYYIGVWEEATFERR
jgi:hypothetical protein